MLDSGQLYKYRPVYINQIAAHSDVPEAVQNNDIHTRPHAIRSNKLDYVYTLNDYTV